MFSFDSVELSDTFGMPLWEAPRRECPIIKVESGWCFRELPIWFVFIWGWLTTRIDGQRTNQRESSSFNGPQRVKGGMSFDQGSICFFSFNLMWLPLEIELFFLKHAKSIAKPKKTRKREIRSGKALHHFIRSSIERMRCWKFSFIFRILSAHISQPLCRNVLVFCIQRNERLLVMLAESECVNPHSRPSIIISKNPTQ